MAQQLRAVVALAEDSILSPNTRVVQLTTVLTSISRDPIPSSGLHRYLHAGVRTVLCSQPSLCSGRDPDSPRSNRE